MENKKGVLVREQVKGEGRERVIESENKGLEK